MKWIFLAILVVLVPVLTNWLRQNPRHAPKVWGAVGFLPFVIQPWHLTVAPIFYEWRGYAKGVEISLLDALSIAILLSLPRRNGGRLPFTLLIFAYIFAVLVSTLQARVPEATLFYVWQLMRMALLFFAVARICDDDRGAKAIISGLVIGLSYQFAYAMNGRFLYHMAQSGGTFGHQNTLGLATHFVVFPTLALLLAGDRSWVARLGPLAGLGTQILTASRATIGFAAIGYVALFLLSGLRRWTTRKALLAGAGLVAVAVAAPLATASLENRFGGSSISFDKETSERAIMEKSTWLMIADHPLGVGANQFVYVANLDGYWARTGVGEQSRASHVHNVFLLSIAELGYLGALPFFLLLGSAIWLCLRTGLGNKRDPRAEIVLGLGVAIAVACLHSFYEFMLLSYHIEHLLFIDLGLVAGLTQKIAADARARRGSNAGSTAERRPARVASDLPALPAQRAGRPPQL